MNDSHWGLAKPSGVYPMWFCNNKYLWRMDFTQNYCNKRRVATFTSLSCDNLKWSHRVNIRKKGKKALFKKNRNGNINLLNDKYSHRRLFSVVRAIFLYYLIICRSRFSFSLPFSVIEVKCCWSQLRERHELRLASRPRCRRILLCPQCLRILLETNFMQAFVCFWSCMEAMHTAISIRWINWVCF